MDFFSAEDEVVEENIELLQANLEKFGVLERFMSLSQACRDRYSLWIRNRLVRGNYYMAHKTAFTAEMLKEKLLEAGFSQAEVKRVG